ncbi:hypothetical protein NE237_024167 [Protea cynaroides]|uniref:Uncharacterized protein n=1 Tax=Protea cynaroides TaxID=273540 RepID=A0A9Q0HDF9_9MAGN|nr:hypothetical protein NE237_024167 [Protea cynaroides]
MYTGKNLSTSKLRFLPLSQMYVNPKIFSCQDWLTKALRRSEKAKDVDKIMPERLDEPRVTDDIPDYYTPICTINFTGLSGLRHSSGRVQLQAGYGAKVHHP